MTGGGGLNTPAREEASTCWESRAFGGGAWKRVKGGFFYLLLWTR